MDITGSVLNSHRNKREFRANLVLKNSLAFLRILGLGLIHGAMEDPPFVGDEFPIVPSAATYPSTIKTEIEIWP